MAVAKQVDFLLAGLRHPETDKPLAAGAVWTYEGGTSIEAPLYVSRDTTEGTATNPIILDSSGKAEVYGNGVYKFVIRDSADSNGDILYEFDNVEYTANISESGVGPLTADLDCDSYGLINMAPGDEPGDAVEYQQWQDSVAALQAADDATNTALANMTFLKLTDTLGGPTASYAGLNDRLLKVTSAANGVDTVSFSSLFNASKAQDLTDIPNFAGEGGKVLTVKADGTAVELKTINDLTNSLFASQTFLNLADVNETSYTGANGQVPVVVEATNKLEFGFPDAKTLQGISVSSTAPAANNVLAFIGGAWTPVAATTLISSGSSLAGGLAYTKTKIALAGEGVSLYNGSSKVQDAPVAFATFDSNYYIHWNRPFTLIALIFGNAQVGPSNGNPFCGTQMASAVAAPTGSGEYRVSCSNLISPGGFNYGEIGSIFFLAPS